MIDDEERKRVAANFRQYLKKYETPDWRAFCNIILGSGRLDNLRKAQAFDRLADLIDRPTYRPVILNEMDGGVFCPQCGTEIGEYGVPNYCYNCGVAIRNAGCGGALG